MTQVRQTESDILAATARKLSEQGYDVVIEPNASFLPESLRAFRPDGIAIGKSPKLVIEVANEGPHNAKRVAELQRVLKEVPDWRLHLVLGIGSESPEIAPADESSIEAIVNRASKLTTAEPEAALLMGWAAFEALGRSRRPNDFARPQSPGRIVERLASEGVVTPSEAAFLRSMATTRNAFIHGDLSQRAEPAALERFLDIIRGLMNSPAMEVSVDKAAS